MTTINSKKLISFVLSFLITTSFNLAFFPIQKAEACLHWSWDEGCPDFENYESTGLGEYNGDYYDNYNRNYDNYNDNYYENGYYRSSNPVPEIYSVSPNSVKTNTSTTITVKGYNFTPSSTVKLNDYTLNTNFINSSTLEARVESFNLAKNNNVVSVFTPAPGGGYSNALSLGIISATSATKNTTTATKNNTSSSKSKNTTTSATTSAGSNNSEDGVDVSKSEKNKEAVNNMAANALFGYNGFLPSSLIQWLFFFIFILLGVILWRKVYVSEKERSVPLKHA